MDRKPLDDDIWDVKTVAENLRTSPRTVSTLIASGEIKGRKVGKGYITTRSAVLDYINTPLQTSGASAGDHEGDKLCQSPRETGYGIVISLPQQAKELDKALERGTKSKRRNCTTN